MKTMPLKCMIIRTIIRDTIQYGMQNKNTIQYRIQYITEYNTMQDTIQYGLQFNKEYTNARNIIESGIKKH